MTKYALVVLLLFMSLSANAGYSISPYCSGWVFPSDPSANHGLLKNCLAAEGITYVRYANALAFYGIHNGRQIRFTFSSISSSCPEGQKPNPDTHKCEAPKECSTELLSKSRSWDYRKYGNKPTFCANKCGAVPRKVVCSDSLGSCTGDIYGNGKSCPKDGITKGGSTPDEGGGDNGGGDNGGGDNGGGDNGGGNGGGGKPGYVKGGDNHGTGDSGGSASVNNGNVSVNIKFDGVHNRLDAVNKNLAATNERIEKSNELITSLSKAMKEADAENAKNLKAIDASLKTVDTSINTMNTNLGTKLDNNKTAIEGLGNKLDGIKTGLDDLGKGTKTTVTGNDCKKANFQCSGNAYECYMAKQAFETKCRSSSDTSLGDGDAFRNFLNQKGAELTDSLDKHNQGNKPSKLLGDSTDISKLNAINESNGVNFNAQCPADRVIDYKFGTTSFSYKPMCDFAVSLRALIMLFASIASIMLFVKYS